MSSFKTKHLNKYKSSNDNFLSCSIFGLFVCDTPRWKLVWGILRVEQHQSQFMSRFLAWHQIDDNYIAHEKCQIYAWIYIVQCSSLIQDPFFLLYCMHLSVWVHLSFICFWIHRFCSICVMRVLSLSRLRVLTTDVALRLPVSQKQTVLNWWWWWWWWRWRWWGWQ